jgi:ATP-dependent RNA helicase DDX24/MAK5
MSSALPKLYVFPKLHLPPCTNFCCQGSGKTLAYGLPILQHLLQTKSHSSSTKRRIQALILAPTRELALQVSTHLNACLTPLVKSERSTAEASKPPRVSVAAIVGGMSPQKQKRILDRGVDVLVATPGRLWDIMGEVCKRLISQYF